MIFNGEKSTPSSLIGRTRAVFVSLRVSRSMNINDRQTDKQIRTDRQRAWTGGSRGHNSTDFFFFFLGGGGGG